MDVRRMIFPRNGSVGLLGGANLQRDILPRSHSRIVGFLPNSRVDLTVVAHQQ